jgi:hypothetical protein
MTRLSLLVTCTAPVYRLRSTVYRSRSRTRIPGRLVFDSVKTHVRIEEQVSMFA